MERLAHVRAFANRLVKAGAVMIVPQGRDHRQRVAKLIWRSAHALSWVAGSDHSAAHRLTFDDLRGVTKHGVYFLRGSHVVGYLLHAAALEPHRRGGFFSHGIDGAASAHLARSPRQ